jgi:TonB-dependent starch-binding outer membrane protein SusC
MVCFLAAQVAADAQRVVTGTVLDQNTGEALIGATVVEKDVRTNGTATDVDGRFSLKVAEGAQTLIVSYTGYQTAEFPIVGTNVVTINLSEGKELAEVVVIGYGTVKREDATGLVQAVSSASFNRGAITGPQELLAGKMAGVVITTDGSPGGGSKIRVRGESSLGASNNPLIVVDGVPLDDGAVAGSRNQLNLINPNDIETFTVLKDAASAAIYGNRASGGVILITTKKGKLGKKISVGYNANLAMSETANRVDVLSASEFRTAIEGRSDAIKAKAVPLLGNSETDWQDEIYRRAITHDHNLNVSGGIGVVPYRVSLGFTDKDGLLKTDNFKRYSSAINLSPGFLNNTLQFNINFKGILNDNHFADQGAIGSALSFDPTKPVRDTSALYGGFTTWKLANGRPNNLAPANPVALLELRDDDATVKQYITSVSVDYRFPFLTNLRANLNVAYDYAHGEGNIVVPNFASFAYDNINGGGVNNVYDQTRKNKLLESYLNYKEDFGSHGFEAMVGYSYQKFDYYNEFTNTDSKGTPEETTEGVDASDLVMLGIFGRLSYDYMDRFFLTANIRQDRTSRFGPDFRTGSFPGISAAVKILDNDRQMLNFLKLRLSYGLLGQQDIGNRYAYLARYQTGFPNAAYQFGDTYYTTIRPNGYIANIKWEENSSFNAGIDYSIIKDRLSGSIDVYQKTSQDLLVGIQLAALSNLTNFADKNIGTMEAQGVELSLNATPVQTRNIRWDLSTNFAWSRSEVVKLQDAASEGYQGLNVGGIAGGVGSNIQNHNVGFAPYSFYVYEQKYDESGKLLEGQFVDRNNDGTVTEADKYRYKNPVPRYVLGLTSSLSVGNFDFSFAGRAHIGNYVYNNVQTDMGYLLRLYNSSGSGYLSNVHQSAVDLNVEKQASLTFSDHYVKNASFFRFDHFTLGYNFQRLIGKNLRIYTTVQNPLVFTQYDGLDPELGGGIDNNVYPRSRTFLFGLGINF